MNAAGHATNVSPRHTLSERRSRCGLELRRVGIVASVAMLGFGLSMGRAAAAPASAPQLDVTASTSTYVGLQVFAEVGLTGGNNPTGTLTFDMFGPSDSTCSSSPLFISKVPVSGSSVDSGHYTTTAVGTYRWEASYGGDANNAPVAATACSDPSDAVIVSPYYSGMSLTAAPVSGATIQASVSLNGYFPTGTISFYLTSPGDTFCSAPALSSTVPVNGSGTYVSVPHVYTVGGSYKWQASYSGDPENSAIPISSCLDPDAAVTAPTPLAAGLLYPTNGQTAVNIAVPVTWQPNPAAQAYLVTVGTTAYGYDLVWSGVLPTSQTSYLVPALPSGTLSAVLYTEINNAWTFQVISFSAASATEAALTSPVSGSSGVGRNQAFTWNTVSGVPGVQGYALWISTVYGGANLVGTGLLPATQSSFTPPTLPAGKTVYVILFTERYGVLTNQAITITTAGAGGNDAHAAKVSRGPLKSPAAVPSDPAP